MDGLFTLHTQCCFWAFLLRPQDSYSVSFSPIFELLLVCGISIVNFESVPSRCILLPASDNCSSPFKLIPSNSPGAFPRQENVRNSSRNQIERNRPIMVAIKWFVSITIVPFNPDMISRYINGRKWTWRSGIDLVASQCYNTFDRENLWVRRASVMFISYCAAWVFSNAPEHY